MIFLAALSLCACPGLTGVGHSARGIGLSDGAAGSDGVQVIGPGKVRLSVARDGRWIEFIPEWNSGRSAVEGGGFFLMALDENGGLMGTCDAASEARVPGSAALDVMKCCEGTRGGLRAPSMNPDDDGDGRADEDQLDGKDNDGD